MEGDGAKPDILVGTAAHMAAYGVAGLLDGSSLVRVGDVEAGVVVRVGADFPDISSREAVRESILKAERILYNDAISGQYIEKMIVSLGIADQIGDRTERLPSAARLMERIGKGQGKEIGFGQIPAITSAGRAWGCRCRAIARGAGQYDKLCCRCYRSSGFAGD